MVIPKQYSFRRDMPRNFVNFALTLCLSGVLFRQTGLSFIYLLLLLLLPMVRIPTHKTMAGECYMIGCILYREVIPKQFCKAVTICMAHIGFKVTSHVVSNMVLRCVCKTCRIVSCIMCCRSHRPVSAGSDGFKFPCIHHTALFSDCSVFYATIWKLFKTEQ